MGQPTVRAATLEDQAAVFSIITLAFSADPVARWATPDPAKFMESMPLVASAFGGRGFAHDSVYIAEGGGGAALWLPPGVEPDSERLGEIIAGYGDPERLDFDQRAKLRLVKAITGDALPFAILMYVWANEVPVGTVLPSPHFDRIRLIVVEQGEAHLGQWREYRRDIVADYRRAFGEEPGDIVSVGVLTDADNTRHVAHAYYGDITLRSK